MTDLSATGAFSVGDGFYMGTAAALGHVYYRHLTMIDDGRWSAVASA